MSIVSYAQNFEDVMLWRALGQVAEGFYIDVGAQHPVIDSVSKAFYEHGWRGMHVEPTTTYATLLRQDRADETVLQAALTHTHGTLTFYEIPETGLSTADPAIAERHKQQGFEIRETTVPCLTLADVFERAGTRDIHWLKIDVEGFERQVLEGWGPSSARPWIVVLESTLPLTTIESHSHWEPLLLDRDYEHVYFDGLNRYYVSAGHPELREAFRAGPNVFDGFALNGTASAPFCHMVQEHHKAELGRVQTERDQAEHAAQQELTRLAEALAMQQELLAKQEQALGEQLRAANDAVRELKFGLVDQDRASVEREQSLVRDHATRVESLHQQLQASQTELRQLTQEGAARERVLTQQASQVRQEVEGLLRSLARRESEFAHELLQSRREAEQAADEQARSHAAQKQALRCEQAEREQALASQLQASQTELRRLAQEGLERERALTQQTTQVRQEMEALLRSLAQRERDFTQELEQTRRELEQIATEQARTHAEQERALQQKHVEREQVLTQQTTQVRQEMEALLRSLAQREGEFAQELLQTRRDAEQAAADQTRTHAEQERTLRREQAEREQTLTQQIDQLRLEVEELLRSLAQRESEFAHELLQAHHDAEQAATEQARRHAEHEQAMQQEHAERQQTLVQQLLTAHGELRSAGAHSHDRENQLAQDVSSKQAELIQLMQAHAALEAQLRKQMAAERHTTLLLQASLDTIHASFTWRITAPLRWIGSLFSIPSPVPQPQAAPIFSSAAAQPPAPACAAPAPTSALTRPHPSETRISALAINPPMNRPSIADTLDELLSYHDQRFVRCAYLTILGREPDPDGSRYYLARVRQGVSKIQILSQLRLSPEGKARGSSLPGLDAAVAPYRYLKLPVIGWLLGLMVRVQHAGATHQKLNAIENHIYVLGDENQHRFAQLENAMTDLHHAVMQQVQTIVTDQDGTPNHSRVAIATTSIQPPEPEGLKQLSPRARDIYFQLKQAVSTHVEGAA